MKCPGMTTYWRTALPPTAEEPAPPKGYAWRRISVGRKAYYSAALMTRRRAFEFMRHDAPVGTILETNRGWGIKKTAAGFERVPLKEGGDA